MSARVYLPQHKKQLHVNIRSRDDQCISHDLQRILMLRSSVDHDMLFHRSILSSRDAIVDKTLHYRSLSGPRATHCDVENDQGGGIAGKVEFKCRGNPKDREVFKRAEIESVNGHVKVNNNHRGFRISFRLSSAYAAIRAQERKLSRPRMTPRLVDQS